MQEWLLILVITMHTNLEKLASRRYSESVVARVSVQCM